ALDEPVRAVERRQSSLDVARLLPCPAPNEGALRTKRRVAWGHALQERLRRVETPDVGELCCGANADARAGGSVRAACGKLEVSCAFAWCTRALGGPHRVGDRLRAHAGRGVVARRLARVVESGRKPCVDVATLVGRESLDGRFREQRMAD